MSGLERMPTFAEMEEVAARDAQTTFEMSVALAEANRNLGAAPALDVARLVRAMDAADDAMTARGYTLASFANERYAAWVAAAYEGREPICGAIEPGPIRVGTAHTCTDEPLHDGEHAW